ncbi:MAG: glucose-1-phosphate adenylyltransferase [Alphaproteobacteria bacterium]|nr:glucose-1-phosphate adenylyltransferase [Alphaproteobacteria bacterium]
MSEEVNITTALKETLVLVLAGGKGSRLKQLTDHQSKPAVPFGGKFRIIDFPLSNCLNSGLRRIGVLTQYKAHSLIQHLQHGWNFLRPELNEFIEIWPAQQQTDEACWYKGTADAVFQNIETIEEHHPKYLLILAGDHVYKQDYSKMLLDHIQNGADATISCVEVPLKKAKSFGVMGIDAKRRVTSFLEKPENPPSIPGDETHALASMGIYIFNTDFLIPLLKEDALDKTSHNDFGKNIIPSLIGKAKLLAHPFSKSCIQTQGCDCYWRDVGTLDSYFEANQDLTSVVPALDLYDDLWPIWSFQEQLPAAKFVFNEEQRRGYAIDSLVSPGCIISGGAVERSLLFSKVFIHSRAQVEECVILHGCDIHREAKLRRVILDENCHIPAKMEIGFNLEEDAKYFEVSENGVVLVTRDALEKRLAKN